MHPGKLEDHTAAARVYHALRSDPGRWWGGSELAEAAATTCVSTRISEVRHQLPAGERLEHRTECENFLRRQYYRLILGGGSPPEQGVRSATPTATADAAGSKIVRPAPGSLFAEGPAGHDGRKA